MMTPIAYYPAPVYSAPPALRPAPIRQQAAQTLQPPPPPAPVTLPNGLQFLDTQPGGGPIASAGQQVSVHYTGTLYPSGQKFDSSLDRGEPFTFTLGAGEVIEGWDTGFNGMRVGGKRTLIVPAALGYGTDGAPPDIPPNATLRFDVELLGVQ